MSDDGVISTLLLSHTIPDISRHFPQTAPTRCLTSSSQPPFLVYTDDSVDEYYTRLPSGVRTAPPIPIRDMQSLLLSRQLVADSAVYQSLHSGLRICTLSTLSWAMKGI